jgi:hypothetical protein
MRKRSLLIGGLMVVWLVILALIAKSSLDRLTVPAWGNPVGGTESLGVSGESQVGQQFTAPWPGLYRIDVVLDPTNAGEAQEITFHLQREPADENEIWSETFSTVDIQERSSKAFEFPPLRDSKEQEYFFYFESEGSLPGEAIAVGYSESAVLNGGSAYANMEPVPGNLQFHSYYTLRTRDRVDVLLTQITEGRPYFLGSKGFYIGLAIIYVFVLGAFLWLVIQQLVEGQQDKP